MFPLQFASSAKTRGNSSTEARAGEKVVIAALSYVAVANPQVEVGSLIFVSERRWYIRCQLMQQSKIVKVALMPNMQGGLAPLASLVSSHLLSSSYSSCNRSQSIQYLLLFFCSPFLVD